MKTIQLKLAAAIIFLATAFFACTKNNPDNGGSSFTPDCSTPKSWANDVNPIIQSSCAKSGCHAEGSTNGPGSLTTYQKVFTYKSNIRAAVASGLMPKDGSLSANQKNAIICWIDNGAQQN